MLSLSVTSFNVTAGCYANITLDEPISNVPDQQLGEYNVENGGTSSKWLTYGIRERFTSYYLFSYAKLPLLITRITHSMYKQKYIGKSPHVVNS